MPEIEGFVLAGGSSSRFGSNKVLASWRGGSMLDRALGALSGVGLTGRIVCPDPRPFRDVYHPLVMGERPGRGPAEGVRAALLASAAPWSLVLAADMPEVGVGALRTLLRAVPGTTGAAVVFREGERIHPFPGLYRATLLEALDRLGAGASMQVLLRGTETVRLDWIPAAARGESLRNVNEPSDMETGA